MILLRLAAFSFAWALVFAGDIARPAEIGPFWGGPPVSVNVYQSNADGSRVPFGGMAKERKIVIGGVVTVNAGPNCRPGVIFDIELRRVGEDFTNKPNYPDFLGKKCPKGIICTVEFDPRAIENLDHGTSYKWRVWTRVHYYWLSVPGGCGRVVNEEVSPWIGVGGTDEAAFHTPATFTRQTVTPREVTISQGRHVGGDWPSVGVDDGNWYQVKGEIEGNYTSAEISAKFPVFVHLPVRAFKARLRAKSSSACRLFLTARRKDSPASVVLLERGGFLDEDTFEIDFPEEMDPFLHPDEMEANLRIVNMSVSCWNAGPSDFVLSIDQLVLTYDLGD